MFATEAGISGPVMIDTTVYIHVAQAKAPQGVLATLAGGGPVLHSAVCLSEIAYSLGRLDPRHPRTPSRRGVLAEILRNAPDYRCYAPRVDDWVGAGVLSGLAARLLGVGAQDERRLLNDGLILFTARRLGATVLTANIGDFDALTQLVPDVKAAFYRAR